MTTPSLDLASGKLSSISTPQIDTLPSFFVTKEDIIPIAVDTAADAPFVEKITVTPSQFANGAPLTSPSANSSLSVNTDQISANSDFGFTVDINTDLPIRF